jgi:hypothetical protein
MISWRIMSLEHLETKVCRVFTYIVYVHIVFKITCGIFISTGEEILFGTSWTNLSRTSQYQVTHMLTAYKNVISTQV